MNSTLAITEKRSTVDKFRNWYQTKIIDTKKASKFEEIIDKNTQREKTIVKVAGSVATIALLFYPADGPVGEICTALATPLLAKIVEKKGEILKKTVIGAKRKIEADYIGVDGSSKKVEIPDFNFTDLTQDITDLKNATNQLASSIEDRGNTR